MQDRYYHVDVSTTLNKRQLEMKANIITKVAAMY